jgi:hypothetical protein
VKVARCAIDPFFTRAHDKGLIFQQSLSVEAAPITFIRDKKQRDLVGRTHPGYGHLLITGLIG